MIFKMKQSSCPTSLSKSFSPYINKHLLEEKHIPPKQIGKFLHIKRWRNKWFLKKAPITSLLTLPEANIAPEDGPSQKGNDRLPIIHFQVANLLLVSGRVLLTLPKTKPWWRCESPMVEALIQIFSSMMMERYGMWVQRHLPNPTIREKAGRWGEKWVKHQGRCWKLIRVGKKENQQKTSKKQGQATSSV